MKIAWLSAPLSVSASYHIPRRIEPSCWRTSIFSAWFVMHALAGGRWAVALSKMALVVGVAGKTPHLPPLLRPPLRLLERHPAAAHPRGQSLAVLGIRRELPRGPDQRRVVRVH